MGENVKTFFRNLLKSRPTSIDVLQLFMPYSEGINNLNRGRKNNVSPNSYHIYRRRYTWSCILKKSVKNREKKSITIPPREGDIA